MAQAGVEEIGAYQAGLPEAPEHPVAGTLEEHVDADGCG